jgi:hypothetical protein
MAHSRRGSNGKNTVTVLLQIEALLLLGRCCCRSYVLPLGAEAILSPRVNLAIRLPECAMYMRPKEVVDYYQKKYIMIPVSTEFFVCVRTKLW